VNLVMTVLGVLVIVIGAALVLGSWGGFQANERGRAVTVLIVGLVVIAAGVVILL
jgi:hypothetical protein